MISSLTRYSIQTRGRRSGYPFLVKRRLGELETDIWPTISPTSSIVVSKYFLESNRSDLIDFNIEWRDIWLDARINMLAMNLSDERVLYSDISVYRRIHGQNDSLNKTITRVLTKQVQATRYLKKNLRRRRGMNLRTYMIHKIAA